LTASPIAQTHTFMSVATRFRWLAVACLLATPAQAHGDDGVLPSDPVFDAVLTDGTTVNGRLGALSLAADGSGSVRIVGDEAREIPLDRLAKLERAGSPAPEVKADAWVLLPDGDRLNAAIGATDDEALQVSSAGRALRIRLDRLVGLVLAPPAEPKALRALVAELRAPRDGGMVWLSNGDRRAGDIVGLDARRVAFDPGTGKIDLERERVVALAFDPALIAYPKPRGSYLELALRDGSRLGVVEARLERGTLAARTRFGEELRIPVRDLGQLDVLGGSVDYLAGRTPLGSQYVGYLGPHPEDFGRDATWDGHPLSLAGRPVARGLGMLPRTLLAYRVEPGDRRFQATVGLDDRAGDQASVVFRVLVDRDEVFRTPPLTLRDAPVPVDVDIANGRSLILVVEFGERGDVQDSADWAEARIIRDPTAPRGGP
jgi:hypothetical protein